MEKKYYVNNRAQANGDHEVHEENCRYMPNTENRRYLGEFSSCYGAVREAKKYHQQANGCKTCSNACHTQ
jgi:hypothetical protein